MMKKSISILTAACMMVMLLFSPSASLISNAETGTTVSGKVMSGTTDDTLYLSTASGKMEIKLDSNTDTSSCKLLLPNDNIDVTVYRGSDAYMHAAKITSALDNSFKSATVNSSSPITLTGVVASGTTPYIMYLSTNSGTMQIRLDDNTNMNGRPLTLGKSVQVTLGYGSDYYHHAISISEL